jgi:hypothetical protein
VVNNELKRVFKEAIVAETRYAYYPGFCLGGPEVSHGKFQ